MTFSTRNNPRLAQSPIALTSLGAVGGARGTAAGALRIFVEFLTTYDKKNLDALENDLRQLDHAQNNSIQAEEKRQTRLQNVRTKLAEADRVVRGKLNSQLRTDLKQIEALETSRSKTNRDRAAQERQAFNVVAKSLGVTDKELNLLKQRTKLKRDEQRIIKANAVAEEGQLRRTRERAQVEDALGRVQAGRANLAPRLAGLAVGAVGGILGGAILGVGFQLAEAAIGAIGDKIHDLIDPSRHARDAIKELGASVVELAQAKDLTILDAAKEKAKELGLAADETTEKLLAQFAAESLGTKSVEDYSKFVEAAAHSDSVRKKNIEDLTKALIEQARAQGTLTTKNIPGAGGSSPFAAGAHKSSTITLIDGENVLIVATRRYDEILRQNIATINENAQARERLANASALARLQQDALTRALQNSANIQIGAIDAQIEALGDVGPSAKTQALEAALEKAQSGGSGIGSQLRNLDQERELILLRQRLRLLGQNIDLEKFTGKFLLEAINAKIAAIQKEGQEQDRLNQLLDLQYRVSQQIKRQAGESIADFVQRRAQEQRHQLQEADSIRRAQQIDELNELKDRVQDEVALAELAEQKKALLARAGADARIKQLQKELEASRKADQEALEAKRKALEAEKEAIRDKVSEAVDLASQQATQEVLAAIRGAKSLQDLAAIEGRIEGLKRAKATIQALVDAFGIPAAIAKPFLDNINKQLDAIGSKEEAFYKNKLGKGGGSTPFAKGGVIELTNARNPFGMNVRQGEEGTELGVILSNKVAQQLRDSKYGAEQIGPFYLQGGNDPWRDKYAFKRIVQDAVREALR